MSETIDYTVGELSGEYVDHFTENSKNPEIIFNHETSKEQQQELHGLGLYMIEDIVKEYDGVVEWKDAGEIFESNLMLKLR